MWEAEESCLAQGGRLYQPRSTRSLQLLKMRSPEFFKSGNSAGSNILSWDSASLTALGMTTVDSDPSYPLTYRDSSKAGVSLFS